MRIQEPDFSELYILRDVSNNRINKYIAKGDEFIMQEFNEVISISCGKRKLRDSDRFNIASCLKNIVGYMNEVDGGSFIVENLYHSLERDCKNKIAIIMREYGSANIGPENLHKL